MQHRKRFAGSASPRLAAALFVAGASLLPVTGPPAAWAASPEPIYRIRVTIVTTSTAANLAIGAPAQFIEARARLVTDRAGASAGFGSFGQGPLRVRQRPGDADRDRRVKASYVVALTPGGTDVVTFLASRETRRDTTLITLWNHNRDDPTLVRRMRHRRGDDDFRAFYVRSAGLSRRGPVPGTGPLRPRVLAFYYPWYRYEDWFGEMPLADYNENDRPYASSNTEAIDRHVAWAQRAGIDGFISSWWGPDTRTDRNLGRLVERLPTGFRFAVYFETLSDHFQTKRDIVDGLAYMLDTYGAEGRYLKFHGQPVVYVYAAKLVLRSAGEGANPNYRAVWRDVLSRLRGRGYQVQLVGSEQDPADLRIFAGTHEYGTTDPRTTYGIDRRMALIVRSFAAVHGGLRRLWGASVIPGYDDRHIPDRSSPLYFDRANGDLFRQQWGAAIATHADQALVVSFNEWPETTNIEPNVEWRGRYLRISGQQAAAFRASR